MYINKGEKNMKESPLKERIYEVELEQLTAKEVEKIDNKKAILSSKLDVVVTIGSCKKNLKDILEFKLDDIIYLDKNTDDDLDININDKLIAKGESIVLDNKVGVRISKFKNVID